MTTCSIAGCSRPHYGRGYCRAHWSRWSRHGNPLAGRTPPADALAFIDLAVRHVGDECVPWPYRKRTGYGRVQVDGVEHQAHRLVLERTAGPAPHPSMQAAHAPGICHNRACVNPAHLRWATVAENHADKIVDDTHRRGQRSPGSKLTEAQVLAVRSDARRGRVIAAELGVHESTVSMIRTGKNWAWLGGPTAKNLRPET